MIDNFRQDLLENNEQNTMNYRTSPKFNEQSLYQTQTVSVPTVNKDKVKLGSKFSMHQPAIGKT